MQRIASTRRVPVAGCVLEMPQPLVLAQRDSPCESLGCCLVKQVAILDSTFSAASAVSDQPCAPIAAACASAEGVRQPTIAGDSWISSSFSRASPMNREKPTRRVILLLRMGSPTCRLHTGRPWLSPSSRPLPRTTDHVPPELARGPNDANLHRSRPRSALKLKNKELESNQANRSGWQRLGGRQRARGPRT